MTEKVAEKVIEKKKVGDRIALTPEDTKTLSTFVEDWQDALAGYVVACKMLRASNDTIIRVVRAQHPELNGYEFRVEHDTHDIVITSGSGVTTPADMEELMQTLYGKQKDEIHEPKT